MVLTLKIPLEQLIGKLLKGEVTALSEKRLYLYVENLTNGDKGKLRQVLKDILEWFKQNISLVGKYLLPIITKDYDGEQLYDHIRTRYQRLNNNLKKLGKILGIEKNLTTYVSRHTMAMTLQGNDVSRETISAVLGHRDIKTTMTYLDSLSQNVLDRVAMLL